MENQTSKEFIRSHVTIDVNNLDVICEEQPSLCLLASEGASKAKADEKAAKYNIEHISSMVELDIREGKTSFTGKMSESSILALVANSEAVVAAKADYIAAMRESGSWDSLVYTYDQRRSMLANETSLMERGLVNMGDIKSRRTYPLDRVDEIERQIIDARKKD